MQTEQAISLLEYYIEAGVDEFVGDTTQNYFALLPKTKILETRNQKLETKVKTNNALTSNPTAAISHAKELAKPAKTIDELHDVVKKFDGCSLIKTANTVFASGSPEADIMIIGDAPNKQEDIAKLPFTGENGYMLTKMFTAIGYGRDDLYLTNSIFWRPPGNRLPTTEEIAICRPFVEKHIALAKPKLLVLLGIIAVKTILGDARLNKIRGEFKPYNNDYVIDNDDKGITVIASFNPSQLMRQPSQKRLAWQDLLSIKSHIADN